MDKSEKDMNPKDKKDAELIDLFENDFVRCTHIGRTYGSRERVEKG